MMSAVCLLSADCLLFVILAAGVLDAAAVRVVEEEVDPLAAAGGQVGPDHVGEGGERAANLHRAHRVPERKRERFAIKRWARSGP